MNLDKYQIKRLKELQELFANPIKVDVILTVEHGRNTFTPKLVEEEANHYWEEFKELEYLEQLQLYSQTQETLKLDQQC